MAFNVGFMCTNCGPMKETKKRTIAKASRDCCKECGGIVTPWQRPLNERAGRCTNCGGSSFILAMHDHDLLRKCKACSEVYNVDQSTVLRQGSEELKYGSRKK